MRQQGKIYTYFTPDTIVSFVALQFATMLFHIAAAAVLTNIAFMEIYSFYELDNNIAENKLLSDEVKPTKFNIIQLPRPLSVRII